MPDKTPKLSLQLQLQFIPKEEFTPDSSIESGVFTIPPRPPVRSKLSAPAVGHAEHVLNERYTHTEFVDEVWGVLTFKVKIKRERYWAYVRRIKGDQLDVILRHR